MYRADAVGQRGKHTLALILLFIAGKIFVNQFGGHVPPTVSLVVTLSLLAGGVVLSIRKTYQGNRTVDLSRKART